MHESLTTSDYKLRRQKYKIQSTVFTIFIKGSEIPKRKEILAVAQASRTHNRSYPYHYCLQSHSPLNSHIVHP